MVKILFIGDIHMTSENSREIEVLRKNTVNLCLDRKPDIIIFAGDQLHTFERMHIVPMNNLCKMIKDLREIAPVYCLVGNHELCLGKDVQVLKWDGTTAFSQDVKVGDALVSSSGEKTSVTKCFKGQSDMYNVVQARGMSYTVNTNHVLTLKTGFHKSKFWNNVKKVWTVKWLCQELQLKSKFFGIKNYTKEQAEAQAKEFLDKIPEKQVIDIPVHQYLSTSKNVRDRLYGFKSSINWPERSVSLDPYVLGMWLGDGSKEGAQFASADVDLIYKWWLWARDNGAKVVHHAQYKYFISNSFYAVSKRLDVFDSSNSSLKCSGCKRSKEVYSQAPSLACASIHEIKLLLKRDKTVTEYFSKNASREQLIILEDALKLRQLLMWKQRADDVPLRCVDNKNNPLKTALKKYNLLHNKHIPDEYIVNNKETRLQLLAGFVDTDGNLTDGVITISQSKKNKGMVPDIKRVCDSLGLTSTLCYKNDRNIISISGDLNQIPTKLFRKQSPLRPRLDSQGRVNRDINRTSIKLEASGTGEYFGFSVDSKDGTFLLGDCTVTHNCNNQQYLTDNHSLNAFKEWEGVTIVDKPIVITLNRFQFTLTPYVPVGRFEEALNTLEEDWKTSHTIFAHQEFKGCKMGSIVSTEGDEWPLDYPFVCSGHIHSTQRPQKNIYYPGSSTQVAFGENDNPIVALLSWDSYRQKEPNIEEIDLNLPTKKIVYTDTDSVGDFNVKKILKEGQDPSLVKLSISGDGEEFKTFKKSKKYAELVKQGVKVVFKPKRAEVVKNKEELERIRESVKGRTADAAVSFKEVLYQLSLEKKDSEMLELYELLVNGNSVDSKDILLL